MKRHLTHFSLRKPDGPLDETERLERREQWLEENYEAIADYNREVARRGVFSEGLRSF
jgi:post-segregation antitoxin (ccd killing protein)